MQSIPTFTRCAAGLAAVLLAGCASAPRVVEADGTYCFRIGKPNRLWRTCTTAPIPSITAEAEAKRFETRPEVATLYIIRRRWADNAYQMPIEIDGVRRVDTIPASFVRVRLKPGSHILSLSWKGRTDATTLTARAGEVHFLEIDGETWIGATSYRWSTGDEAGARQRAARSTFIADVDLSTR